MKHLHDKVVTWPARDGECNVSCIIWFIGCNIMRVLSGDIDTVLTPHVTHVKSSYWHWQWGLARLHTPPRILFLNNQQLDVPVKIESVDVYTIYSWEESCWRSDVMVRSDLVQPGALGQLSVLWWTDVGPWDYSWLTVRLYLTLHCNYLTVDMIRPTYLTE